MLKKVLKRIAEACSLKGPKGSISNRRKSGFTIVELMVVIIIVNLLSGVAIPKLSDLIERSKERVDLLKLFYLRDALNRHMYESDLFEGASAATNGNQLSKYLTSNEGASLFIIELHNIMPANYQGSHNNAKTNNVNQLTYKDGFLSTVLKESGFEAVADIVQDRNNGNKYNLNSKTYTTQVVKNGTYGNYTRTYPTKPLFGSRILNGNDSYQNKDQFRIALKIQWTGRNPDSHSLEVFFANGNSTGNWQSSLYSRRGTCFSTYGMAGCKNSKYDK
jgi:prepilin-type N-terminal cleavage/methylation domain-containing protein